jgi:ribosomal protein L37AE/L43A
MRGEAVAARVEGVAMTVTRRGFFGGLVAGVAAVVLPWRAKAVPRTFTCPGCGRHGRFSRMSKNNGPWLCFKCFDLANPDDTWRQQAVEAAWPNKMRPS